MGPFDLLDKLMASVRRIAARWRRDRQAGDAHVDHAGQVDASTRYLVVVRTCGEARLALMRGRLDEAAACIERAKAVDATHPELPELIARLHLARGELADARDTLERSSAGQVRRQLLRLVLVMQSGDAAAAHLELNQWTRRPDCPPTAAALAAWVGWQSGDTDAARRILARTLRDRDDSLCLRLATLIEHEAGQPVAMNTHLSRLRQRFGHRPRARAFVRAVDIDADRNDQSLTIDLIDQLAGELLASPDVIPTLVAAQRWARRADRIELLRRAIGRVVDDVPEPYEALEALAELAVFAGDLDAAQRWARRGLAIKPMSAKLALILDQVDCALTPADAPSPAHSAAVGSLGVLRRVAEAHPHYADVQQALYHRYHRAGMAVLADRHLEQWMQRQPNHPIAHQLAQEAAA